MQFKLMHYTTMSLLLTACICTVAMCRPQDPSTHNVDPEYESNEYYGDLTPDTIRKIKKCEQDIDLMELCMRCAKVTLHNGVYPMCCNNDDNITTFCANYIYYGKKSNI